MSIYPDLNRPYEELGNQEKGKADFIRQDGTIYGWSESNCNYEKAWWLYTTNDSPLVRALKRERPLPEGVVI